MEGAHTSLGNDPDSELVIGAGAGVPFFDLRAPAASVVGLGSASPRRLCRLAGGFVEGAAALFSEAVSIEQTSCMERGAETGLLLCSFSGKGWGDGQ